MFVMTCNTILLFFVLSTVLVEPKKVIGLIFTSCQDHQPTLHTPINSELFPPHKEEVVDDEKNKMSWLADPSTTLCSPTIPQVLAYCRQIYNDSESGLIDQAVSDPFDLSYENMYLPNGTTMSDDAKLFWCLAGSEHEEVPVDDLGGSLLEHQVNRALKSYEPSLIDIHRAYFSERFRELYKTTNASVSQVVDELIRHASGLRKLHRSGNPELARATLSHSLEVAHKRLMQLWLVEELKRFEFEQTEHEDIVKELNSEDLASVNEFTYVSQERDLNLNQVQIALSNLLNRLTHSVDEEVRFLHQIQSHQPWALRVGTNWTEHVTQGVIDLGRIHHTLINYVHTATWAINTFMSLVTEKNLTKIHFTIDLRKNYDGLQAILNIARDELNKAKSMLIRNMTDRMHSIVNKLRSGKLPLQDTASLEQWVESRHHEELARIDLLVLKILGLSRSPFDDWTYSRRQAVKLLPRFFGVFFLVLVVTLLLSLSVSCCCIAGCRTRSRTSTVVGRRPMVVDSLARYWSVRIGKMKHIFSRPVTDAKRDRRVVLVTTTDDQQRVPTISEACGVPLLLVSGNQYEDERFPVSDSATDFGYMNPVYNVMQRRTE